MPNVVCSSGRPVLLAAHEMGRTSVLYCPTYVRQGTAYAWLSFFDTSDVRTTLAAVILNHIGLYCEQSWSPRWGHIYVRGAHF